MNKPETIVFVDIRAGKSREKTEETAKKINEKADLTETVIVHGTREQEPAENLQECLHKNVQAVEHRILNSKTANSPGSSEDNDAKLKSVIPNIMSGLGNSCNTLILIGHSYFLNGVKNKGLKKLKTPKDIPPRGVLIVKTPKTI